jgi:hypothetical protein
LKTIHRQRCRGGKGKSFLLSWRATCIAYSLLRSTISIYTKGCFWHSGRNHLRSSIQLAYCSLFQRKRNCDCDIKRIIASSDGARSHAYNLGVTDAYCFMRPDLIDWYRKSYPSRPLCDY